MGLRSRRGASALTALQITSGENWQNVAEGSIMYRMFRGWNERRLVIGKSMLRYEGKDFVEVQDINDARIAVGSNLQNAAFWRQLETEDFVPVLQTNPDTTNYVIALGTVEEDSGILTVYDSYATSVDDRYSVSITPTAEGDILAMEKINAILRRMYAYKDAHVRFGRVKFVFDIRESIPTVVNIPGANPSCSTSVSEYFVGGLNDFVNPLVSDGLPFYTGGGGCGDPPDFSGCEEYQYTSCICNYSWPSTILTESNKFIWWTLNKGEFLSAPTQETIIYKYNKQLNFTQKLGGVFNTANIHGNSPTQSYWNQNGAIDLWPVCEPNFLVSFISYASTNNIITEPIFADLGA